MSQADQNGQSRRSLIRLLSGDAVLYRLLGSLEVEGDTGLISPGGTKPRAVLAQLLLHPNRAVSLSRLVDGLWGDDPPQSATHCLRVYVCTLRRKLFSATPDVLATSGSGYALFTARDTIDVCRFKSAVAAGLEALRGGDAARAWRLLDDGLKLWRGPALDGLAQEPFAPPHVAYLEELKITALEHRVAAELIEGRHAQLVPELEELVILHPLRETLWHYLMVALWSCGRQAEAVAAYDRLRETLVSQLGIEPNAHLKSLLVDILQQNLPRQRSLLRFDELLAGHRAH